MLDNFSLQELRQAVDLIGDRAATEASGGITLERLPALAHLGLDFISTGATVHQATWMDIGLDWI
jgi:nicotinate-nucleotide pyrophosphorylase (carboxylating)